MFRKNTFKACLCAAVLAAASTVQAATISAGGISPGALGRDSVGSTQSSPDTLFFETKAAGRLNNFTVWVKRSSSALFLDSANISVQLLGKQANPNVFPALTDTLGSRLVRNSVIKAGPVLSDPVGVAYVPLSFGLYSFNIEAHVGENFAVRISPTTAGSLDINSLRCNFAANACTNAANAGNRLATNGTQSLIGTPSTRNFWRYSVTVNTASVEPPLAAVPLPAGLPLLLAGLGVFGWVRRAQHA